MLDMPVALGLDIGGTQIKAALVDSTGAVLDSARINTPLNSEDFRTEFCALIRGLVAGGPVVGAGVACKGVVEPATTRLECLPGVMRFLENWVLSDVVCDGLGVRVPVFADNDARVALVGECVWGAARGRRDVIMLTLGTGVGGAILSDGRIIRGHRGVAGHLGHLTVDVDGPPCMCGNRGCLESVFSARVIEAGAFSAIHRGLVANVGGSASPSCAEIFAAARDGDETARWVVEEGVRKLGAAIAGLVHALDPEIVILGGQVAAAGDTLFVPVREEVEWRTRTLLRRTVPIVPTEVHDPSGVLGAAALVFEN